MSDIRPNPTLFARGGWPFILGGLFSVSLWWVGGFLISATSREPHSVSHLFLIWAAVTIIWTACLPTIRPRVAFLLGSALGFFVGAGGIQLLMFLMTPVPNTYPG